MIKDKKTYLEYIMRSILQIEWIVSGIEEFEFEKNFEKIAACSMLIQTIWEYSKQLSKVYPEVEKRLPIKDMIDLRNEISHEYFGLLPEKIRLTATKDVLEIKVKIEFLMKEK